MWSQLKIHIYCDIYIYIYIYIWVNKKAYVYMQRKRIYIYIHNIHKTYTNIHIQKTNTQKCVYIYIYIYIYIDTHKIIYRYAHTDTKHMYEAHTISFQTFFVSAFKIVVDSWRFSMLWLYILWDDWPIFMILDSKEQLQQQLEYTLLKLDCHNRCISKMQSDTLEERYAIKFSFKLGKKCHRNVWNASDCFWSILHESSISFLMA